MRFRSIELVLVGSVLFAGRLARADDGTSAGESPDVTRRINRTAYTLDQGQVDIGVESFAVAPFDELTIGTYVTPWLLLPYLGLPVPNAFIKARTPFIG